MATARSKLCAFLSRARTACCILLGVSFSAATIAALAANHGKLSKAQVASRSGSLPSYPTESTPNAQPQAVQQTYYQKIPYLRSPSRKQAFYIPTVISQQTHPGAYPGTAVPAVVRVLRTSAANYNYIRPARRTMSAFDSVASGFRSWLSRFKEEARSQGVTEYSLRLLNSVSLDETVARIANRRPKKSKKKRVKTGFNSYYHRHVSRALLQRGRDARLYNKATIKRVTSRYPVTSQMLMGIWGIETHFGALRGNHNVLQSLATLAYDSKRRPFFRRELLAALKVLDMGLVQPHRFNGSWAGAMGQGQFMPTSYLKYAVDQDGDQLADIWDSIPDALASIANYMLKHGWVPGLPWGLEVFVPRGLNKASLGVVNTIPNGIHVSEGCRRVYRQHSAWRTLSQWKALGVTPRGRWPRNMSIKATLLVPYGAGGRAWLTTKNFHSILKYNCSNFYALTAVKIGNAVH